jgi:hypothetical protein
MVVDQVRRSRRNKRPMDPAPPLQYVLSPLFPSSTDLAPLNVIRTETVLSKLPIHSLAKKGYVEIGIVRRNAAGQVDLRWEVSYSSKYGPPRQLAYKLDTLIVNRRIDEHRRPVPKSVRLGSLSQICAELDLPASGRNTNNVKKAIQQNAGSLITARFNYTASDGSERRLEAIFTRYSVVFTGERLPDGRDADGVYLIFTDPYWDVLNKAPVRPLNYDYLKALAPTPQRFYEVLSYRMFVSLKYEHAAAKLPYSEYCTYSAQQRYYDYDRFKKQMYKVQKPHLVSGYIAKVRYEAAVDTEGRQDWNMYYEPGPRARAEFAAFYRGAGAPVPVTPAAGASGAENIVVTELMRRGVSEPQARRLEAELGDRQPVLEQLEWGDHVIRKAGPKRFYNPPGFYVYLLKQNILPPPEFVRRSRVEAEPAVTQRPGVHSQLELQAAYDEHRKAIIDRMLAFPEVAQRLAELIVAKEIALPKQYRSLSLCPKETLRELAESAARGELAASLQIETFAEFCEAHKKAEPTQLSLES